ncbi:MAG: GTPase domain-containing protein [Pseudomonadota bacterium]
MSPRPAKILLLGAPDAGKTALARQLKFHRFWADRTERDLPWYEITTLVDGKALPLVLWDTTPTLDDTADARASMRGADAAMVVADTQCHNSVSRMLEIASDFRDSLPGKPLACVLNKIDLQPPSDLLVNSASRHADFVTFCSARTGQGTAATLHRMAAAIYRRNTSV